MAKILSLPGDQTRMASAEAVSVQLDMTNETSKQPQIITRSSDRTKFVTHWSSNDDSQRIWNIETINFAQRARIDHQRIFSKTDEMLVGQFSVWPDENTIKLEQVVEFPNY